MEESKGHEQPPLQKYSQSENQNMYRRPTCVEFDDLLMNESLITKKNEKLLKTFVSRVWVPELLPVLIGTASDKFLFSSSQNHIIEKKCEVIISFIE